jgi:hypothetical protein
VFGIIEKFCLFFSIRLAVSWSQRLEKSLTLLTQAETGDVGEKKTSGKGRVTKNEEW